MNIADEQYKELDIALLMIGKSTFSQNERRLFTPSSAISSILLEYELIEIDETKSKNSFGTFYKLTPKGIIATKFKGGFKYYLRSLNPINWRKVAYDIFLVLLGAFSLWIVEKIFHMQ